MSMYGAREPIKPREIQGHNQNEEEPDTAHRENSSLRIF